MLNKSYVPSQYFTSYLYCIRIDEYVPEYLRLKLELSHYSSYEKIHILKSHLDLFLTVNFIFKTILCVYLTNSHFDEMIILVLLNIQKHYELENLVPARFCNSPTKSSILKLKLSVLVVTSE